MPSSILHFLKRKHLVGAWAAGQSVGASGGGGLAQITSNAVPCIVLGLTLLSTLGLVYRSA